MPGIDNYSLDNYGLDGFLPTEHYYTNVNIPRTEVVLSPGQTGVLATVITFPAGTKMISIFPRGNSETPYVSCVYSEINMNFSLMDDGGRIAYVSPTRVSTTSTTNLLHTQITLDTFRIYSQYFHTSQPTTAGASTAWSVHALTTPPTNFNLNGPLSLVVYVLSNTSTTTNQVYYAFNGSYGISYM